MALNVPGLHNQDGPDLEDEPALFAEINITPLTDVVLVLLIIFMVASGAMINAARQGQLGVNLPHTSSTGQTAMAESPVVVSVLQDGRVLLSGTVISDDLLLDELTRAYTEKPKSSLVVEADGELAHKRVVFVIDTAQKAGFKNIGIAVEENGSETR